MVRRSGSTAGGSYSPGTTTLKTSFGTGHRPVQARHAGSCTSMRVPGRPCRLLAGHDWAGRKVSCPVLAWHQPPHDRADHNHVPITDLAFAAGHAGLATLVWWLAKAAPAQCAVEGRAGTLCAPCQSDRAQCSDPLRGLCVCVFAHRYSDDGGVSWALSTNTFVTGTPSPQSSNQYDEPQVRTAPLCIGPAPGTIALPWPSAPAAADV